MTPPAGRAQASRARRVRPLTRAINMSRVNSLQARLITTAPLLLLLCQHFLGNGHELPAFGHANPRTVQEVRVFSFFANGTLIA